MENALPIETRARVPFPGRDVPMAEHPVPTDRVFHGSIQDLTGLIHRRLGDSSFHETWKDPEGEEIEPSRVRSVPYIGHLYIHTSTSA